jgi:type VI secretion system secreted protein Hcp
MAFDAFLKVNGGNVKGESTDDKHKEWIEILSFSWGVSQMGSGAASSGGSLSSERADFADFSIVKTLDNASPQLYLACSNGTHLGDIELELCRAGGEKEKYMSYKMEDVLVTSARPGGSSQGGEALPLEEVSFRYGKITWEYTYTDPHGGAGSGANPTHWDLKANKGG